MRVCVTLRFSRYRISAQKNGVATRTSCVTRIGSYRREGAQSEVDKHERKQPRRNCLKSNIYPLVIMYEVRVAHVTKQITPTVCASEILFRANCTLNRALREFQPRFTFIFNRSIKQK